MLTPREPRLVAECDVEFPLAKRRVTARTEDVSHNGSYVRTTEFLPMGAVVELSIALPARPASGGQEAAPSSVTKVIARVAHVMPVNTAKVLGRQPGMGFEFLDAAPPDLAAFVDSLTGETRFEAGPPEGTPRVFVVDDSVRMRERLSAALGQLNYEVEAIPSGSKAYKRLQEPGPEGEKRVVVIDETLIGMDGWTLLKMLAGNPELADLPTMFLSRDSGDLTRLKAYRLGVRDFLHAPFRDEELLIRLRRLVESRPPRKDKVVMRGTLEEIGVATLLSLLDFERKSGVLLLLQESTASRIFVAEGRVVKVEGPQEQSSTENLQVALGWTEGSFEFWTAEVVGHDEVDMTTQQILIEAARIADEASDEAEGIGDEVETES